VTYKGLPKATITWGKDEKTLKTGGNITIDTKDTLTTLNVKKVTRADDGLYFITAENEAGKAKASFDVEVIGTGFVFFNLHVLYFSDDRPLLFFSNKPAAAYTPNATYLLFYKV
jgi:hypothetical protein